MTSDFMFIEDVDIGEFLKALLALIFVLNLGVDIVLMVSHFF